MKLAGHDPRLPGDRRGQARRPARAGLLHGRHDRRRRSRRPGSWRPDGATRFRLRVYTPERELVDGDVREVTAPGAYGEIGVLPDHAALVTALEPGVAVVQAATARVAKLADRRRLRRGARQRDDRARRLRRAASRPRRGSASNRRPMGKLDGKMALVTGGGRGIGRGIVARVRARGRRRRGQLPPRPRGGGARRRPRSQPLGRRADGRAGRRRRSRGRRAHGRRGASPSLGALDIAVANSGVASRVAPVAEIDPGEWRRVMATDLDGAFYTARAVHAALSSARRAALHLVDRRRRGRAPAARRTTSPRRA